MRNSVLFWLSAAYRRADVPAIAGDGLAADDMPSRELQEALDRLSQQWQNRFASLARWLGKEFASSVTAYADKTLDARLRSKGLSIPFTQSPGMRDALQAVINEQVELIRSLPEQAMTQVSGLVMRSVARGRDLGTLTEQLQKHFGVSRRRAALIARDQNNKATSVMSAARQQHLGVTEGVWRHSHAGKTPRPSHVAADGERFKLSTGLFLDDEWVLPGEAINCRCTWDPVIPGLGES